MFLDKIIYDVIKSQDKNSFGVKEKILFFKELGYLLKGGVGIMDAMKTILNDTDNYALKDIINDIIVDLDQGKTFSYSLMKHIQYFDEGDISIIKAGEKTGRLGDIIQSLSREYQFIIQMQNKYIGALTYPIVLFVLGFIAVIALFIFVLPGIFAILDQFPGMKLPGITIFLQNMANFMANSWIRIVIGIIIFSLFVSILFSTIMGQKLLYDVIFFLPIIGDVTKSYYLIKISRYAKIMINAGMNYIDVFKLLKGIINNVVYDELFDDVIDSLKKGGSIYLAFKNNLYLIPSTVSALVKVGEKTANLSNSFDNVIEIYEESLNSNINNLSKVIEPVMLVIIGGIVVVISLGVFGIITSIMDAVNV